jgi:cytochrome c oxidase subunit 1
MTGDRPKEVGVPVSEAKSSTLFTESGSTTVVEPEKDIN